jgi:hypothetical protein
MICLYAECYHAECRVFPTIMLNVNILSALLSVIMLSVKAPK